MKFSARTAARKWPCGAFRRDQRPVAAMSCIAMLGIALFFCAAPAQASRAARMVPLPMPRPAEAPAQQQQPAEAEKPAQAEKPAAEQRPQEPQSACRLALTDAIAIAPSIPAIHGPGACGGDDLVRLEAVVLADKTRVALKPAATLRCTMASAIADWVRTDITALAAGLGTRPAELDNFDSFDCRGRNRVVGAKISEHGRANALDVRGVKLASGQSIALTERGTARDLREKVLASVCARFTTVLGPGSDGYHEDHIHLDLAERRGNYRICQWAVWDALPQVAPLMPVERPAEAPPREVADAKGADVKGADVKGAEAKGADAKGADAAGAKQDDLKRDDVRPAPVAAAAPDQASRKPVRSARRKRPRPLLPFSLMR